MTMVEVVSVVGAAVFAVGLFDNCVAQPWQLLQPLLAQLLVFARFDNSLPSHWSALDRFGCSSAVVMC